MKKQKFIPNNNKKIISKTTVEIWVEEIHWDPGELKQPMTFFVSNLAGNVLGDGVGLAQNRRVVLVHVHTSHACEFARK